MLAAMAGYKVVGNDLKANNGYQYEIGKTHIQEWPIRLCKSGLHYCKQAGDAEVHGRDLVRRGKLTTPIRYLRVEDRETSPQCRDVGTDKIATRTLFVLSELTPEEWSNITFEETQLLNPLRERIMHVFKVFQQQHLGRYKTMLYARQEGKDTWTVSGALDTKWVAANIQDADVRHFLDEKKEERLNEQVVHYI